MKRPLAVELFCGRFGWSRGLATAGFRSIGFDISHEPYHGKVPDHCELVLQDVLTLHGSQFKDARVIVASPPCQNYSYLAMPWSRSKCPLCNGKKHYFAWQLERGVAPKHFSRWGDPIPCDCKENSAKAKALRNKWETEGPDNRLFDACFRIQREAIEATRISCPICISIYRDGRGVIHARSKTGATGCFNCGGRGFTER